MKVLVATRRTQGARAGDYDWCVDGELVWIQEPCGRDRRREQDSCGCGRGFAGLASHRATTTAEVRTIPGMTRDQYASAIRMGMEDGGWPGSLAEEIADELLDFASGWREGACSSATSTSSVSASRIRREPGPGGDARRPALHRRLRERWEHWRPGWYPSEMSGPQAVTVGDKGRIVVPFEIRARRNWIPGTTLVMVETPDGVLLTDRRSALRVIRERLAGSDLVSELIADRRSDAAAEDVARNR